VEEALRRARAYDDAGADLCLVHSKSESPEEILAVGAAWDRTTPLVCVPTTYKQATVAELSAGGYQVVIFANHGLRSAIRSMRETLATLRREGFAASVDDRVVSLSEVFDLVGVDEMIEEERRFAGLDDNPAPSSTQEQASSSPISEAG
jgi:phosphoenolpyruvate phosphomutase